MYQTVSIGNLFPLSLNSKSRNALCRVKAVSIYLYYLSPMQCAVMAQSPIGNSKASAHRLHQKFYHHKKVSMDLLRISARLASEKDARISSPLWGCHKSQIRKLRMTSFLESAEESVRDFVLRRYSLEEAPLSVGTTVRADWTVRTHCDSLRPCGSTLTSITPLRF